MGARGGGKVGKGGSCAMVTGGGIDAPVYITDVMPSS